MEAGVYWPPRLSFSLFPCCIFKPLQSPGSKNDESPCERLKNRERSSSLENFHFHSTGDLEAWVLVSDWERKDFLIPVLLGAQLVEEGSSVLVKTNSELGVLFSSFLPSPFLVFQRLASPERRIRGAPGMSPL